MKKRLIGLALALAMILSLTACGNEKNTADTPANDGQAAASDSYKGMWIRNTASGMGGIWYPMAVAMNIIWQDNLPGISCKVIAGSSSENVRLVANGETEIGWCHSVAIVDALNGEAPYDDNMPYENISHIAAIHPSAIHIYARKDSGITSIEDLNGKNVGMGSAGSTIEKVTSQILSEEYGITKDTIQAAGGTVVYTSSSDMVTMIQDKQLDAFFSQSTYPSSDVAEIESDLVLLEIDGDKLENFLANHENWLSCTIPGGTYSNQPDDYTTLASYVVAACPMSMDEQEVYDMTKSMWENVDSIYEASADAKAFMSLEIATICKDIIPLHPGAERYYQEIGVL